MPVSCCAVNCTNRFKKGSGIGFYVFPVNVERKKGWLQAISRGGGRSPKDHDRLCGAHFVSGKPSHDPKSVDFVPTIFFNSRKRSVPTVDTLRDERAVKRLQGKEEHERGGAQDAAKVFLSIAENAPCVASSHDVDTQTDLAMLFKETEKEQSTSTSSNVLGHEVPINCVDQLSLIRGRDDKTKFYTGLPTFTIFTGLLEFLKPAVSKVRGKGTDGTGPNRSGRPFKLTLEEEFFSVLLRLRLGLLLEDVADRFSISIGTASSIFSTWIEVMACQLQNVFPWPTRELVRNHTPPQFQKYQNTRIIIDCTEVYIQRPSSLTNQAVTFSNYKHHNTAKALIGISPGGVITFVSKLWGGSISDIELTKRSGLIDLIEEGDNVMADRGFDLRELLEARKATLNIPPFLGQRQQLTSQEVEETRCIAELRIYVERAIGRVKQFCILNGVVPITLAKHLSNIFTVCCYLTNFLPPIINETDKQ